MQLVRDVMTHNLLYVTPDATVRTAVELLRVHGMETVPVVEHGRVIGLLDALALTVYDGEVPVLEAMQEPVTLEAELPLSQAGMRMRATRLRQMPVVRNDQLVGLISARDLLANWGTVNDPLTGLAIQHQFRRWVALTLASGREVSILFLDLNDFGALNKQHGHVYGDQVLQCVAEVLRQNTDPERDFLCRYGGDEFAVATTLPLRQARELAEQLRDRIATVCTASGPVHTGVSIGIAGGRRTGGRVIAHPDSTLDDLLTRASTASTRAKHVPEHIAAYEGNAVAERHLTVVESERSRGGRVILTDYRVRRTGQQYEVSVVLEGAGQSHEKQVFAREDEVTRALATATAECLQSFFRRPVQLKVEETYQFTTPQGLECVGATVEVTDGSGPVERLVGAAPIRDDLLRTYVHAVLDATNRRVTRG